MDSHHLIVTHKDLTRGGMRLIWILSVASLVQLALTGQDTSMVDVIRRKLAAENADLARVLTYIVRHPAPIGLPTHQQDGDDDGGGGGHQPSRQENESSQCCPTRHSGLWCRRPRREHEGEDLYDATDWAASCPSEMKAMASDESPSNRDSPRINMPALYSVLLNFGLNNYYHFLVKLQNYQDEDHGCPTGFVWDPFYLTCRQVYCSADNGGGVFDGEDCIDDGEQGPVDWGNQYIVEMEAIGMTLYADAVYSNQTISEDVVQIVQESFIPAFAAFMGIQPERISDVVVNLTENLMGPNTESLSIDFMLQEAEKGSGEPSIDTIVALIGSLIVQDDLVLVVDDIAIHLVGLHEQPVDSQEESFANWCRGGVTATYFNEEFTIDVISSPNGLDNETEFRVYINSTGKWHESGEFLANILLQGSVNQGSSQYVVSGYVVVCENRSVLLDTSCMVVHLNESEFIFAENGTVFYTGPLPFVDPVLEPNHYQCLPNGDVAVCLYYENYYFPEALTVSSYLEIVLTSLSIVAMCCTIITYLIFRELRNLPGLVVLNLCISTVLFQLSLMVGLRPAVEVHPTLCIIAAIIIHYEGLASFFWTNVMAADLYLTLGRWSAVPRSTTKILPRYMLYAYGVPLVIVAVAIAFNFCGCTGNFMVGYGQLYCYISDPNANLVFFGIPLGIVLVINLILFVLSVNIIRRASSSVKKQQTQNSNEGTEGQKSSSTTQEGNSSNARNTVKRNCKFGIYARMATVLGFTWVFGLVSASLCSVSTLGVVFAYLYSIFNGLEGVMIFAAFTCNRRVLQLYKQLWAEKRKKKSSTTEVKTNPKRSSQVSTTSTSSTRVPNYQKKQRPSQVSAQTVFSEVEDELPVQQEIDKSVGGTDMVSPSDEPQVELHL